MPNVVMWVMNLVVYIILLGAACGLLAKLGLWDIQSIGYGYWPVFFLAAVFGAVFPLTDRT